jgi:hypothetical protein
MATKMPDPTPAAPEPATAQTGEKTPAEKATADKLSSERENADKQRIAEARSAGKKRSEARKFAEEQRRQRELDVAAGAVRHIIHDRDGEIIVREAPEQDVVEVDQAEPPEPGVRPFNFFGR